MSKFDYLNLEAIKHFGTNLNNSKIARIILPDANKSDFSTLRKHISTLRIYKDSIILNNPIFSNKETKKSLAIHPFENGNPDNVLVIGDLHAPFTLTTYLKFCREQQENYNCGTVIFIGDIIDNHFSSYHESDPDGYGAGEELDRAIDMIKEYKFDPMESFDYACGHKLEQHALGLIQDSNLMQDFVTFKSLLPLGISMLLIITHNEQYGEFG